MVDEEKKCYSLAPIGGAILFIASCYFYYTYDHNMWFGISAALGVLSLYN